MTAVRIPTAMKVDTKPIVHPSLSMRYLLLFISTALGLPPLKCFPGVVGLRCSCAYQQGNGTWPVRNWLEFDPVNISGKYLDNVPPTPEGSAFPVFCSRSIQGIALMVKYPALKQALHWSVFPVPLSCKVQPVTSYLLY